MTDFSPSVYKRFFLVFFLILMGFAFSQCSKKRSLKDIPGPEMRFSTIISGYTSGIISKASSIRVRFVGQPGLSPEENDFKGIFSFSPGIKGRTQWKSPGEIEFIPDEFLKPGEVYEVKFNLRKILNVPDSLAEFSFGFMVMEQDIEIRDVFLEAMEGNDLETSRLSGTVVTADIATEQEVEASFQIASDGKTPLVTWSHFPDRNLHQFSVENLTRSANPQTVTISWDGSPMGVDRQMKEEYTIPAKGDFSVLEIKNSFTSDQYLSIRFSDPLDPHQNLEGLVSISETSDLRYIINRNEIKVYPPDRITGSKKVIIHPGIKNIAGVVLVKEMEKIMEFVPVEPSVVIAGKGVIIPDGDNLLLPIEAVGLNAIDVQVVQIFENNVPHFLQVNRLSDTDELSRHGRRIVNATVRLDENKMIDLRKPNRFSIDLGDYMRPEPGALYNVQLSFKRSYAFYNCGNPLEEDENIDDPWGNDPVDNAYWHYDYYYPPGYRWIDRDDPCTRSYYNHTRWAKRNLLASHLGITAKQESNNRTMIAVSDLMKTHPLSGVNIKLYDFQLQELAEGFTNENGFLFLDHHRKPFLAVAEFGKQKGYLRLDDGTALSLSRFDVSGDEVQHGLKGFIYGDRGVWRPGDSLYLTFLLEEKAGKLPEGHPVKMELFDPSGRLLENRILKQPINGFYDMRTSTSQEAPTGNWMVKVQAGGATFQKSLRIETVMPNRLKLQVETEKDALVAGENNTADLHVKWLHGAVAPNLNATVDVSLLPSEFRFDKFASYTFKDPTRRFTGGDLRVFDGVLDENGNASFPLDFNVEEPLPSVMDARLFTRVFEPGGAFSIDYFTIPFHPYNRYLGIQPPEVDNEQNLLLTDTDHRFQFVSVTPEGDLAKEEHKVKIEVFKIDWNWWWDSDGEDLGAYAENSHMQALLVEEISLREGKGSWNFRIAYPEWGRFLIRATDETTGHATAHIAYVDWPGWEGRSRSGNAGEAVMLALSSDKEKYQPGEDVQVVFPSAEKGRALVTIESAGKILEAYWVETKQGETRFSFESTAEMAPNAYVHISLIQPHAQTINDLPIRLYGVIPILVEDPQTRLQPILKIPDEVRPETKFTVEVSEASGKPFTYTIAIVDEGLLDLTRFTTPDPHRHFFARQALDVKTWDLFDHVLGAYGIPMERLLEIGGDDAATIKGTARASRFIPVVKYLGPFELGKKKSQKHEIILPPYMGSVRAMIVCGQNGAYGSAEKTVAVRKPLMILPTIPRSIGIGERFSIPVTVFSMDKAIRQVEISLKTNNLLTPVNGTSRTTTFSSTGEKMVYFDVEASSLQGVGAIELQAKSGNETASYRIELQVENPNPFITRQFKNNVEAGKKGVLEYDLLGMEGTNTATLEVSSLPPINLESRLGYLISYPHGCVEQITSAVFPQLFLPQLTALDENDKQRARRNIRNGLNRLIGFQLPSGGLGYWPGSEDANNWGTSYAGHFLLEAQKLGFPLPEDFRYNWINYQRKIANNWMRRNNTHDLDQAYRLYTLALAKEPELGAMNRLKEDPALSNAARWRLAAAYALAGQYKVAEDLIIGLPLVVDDYRELSATFGSATRDEAMILETLVLLNRRTEAMDLVNRLSDRLSAEEWLSTQSTSFALLAIGRYVGNQENSSGLAFSYSHNGNSQKWNSQEPVARIHLPVGKDGKQRVEITNESGGILYCSVVAKGQPASGVSENFTSSLAMDVRFTNLEGQTIDPENLEQGMDLVAEVTVKHPGGALDYKNMALTQAFPAGWEIINTRLVGISSGSDDFTYQDIRDTKVFTYFDLNRGQQKTFKVLLNASYGGRYFMPPVYCEAMYDQRISARVGGTWVEVAGASESQ